MPNPNMPFSSGPLLPQAVNQALSVPPTGGNAGYRLAALPDGSIGWVASPTQTAFYQTYNAAGTDSYSGAGADATTYGSWTVAIPYTKTYLLHVDLSWYFTVGQSVQFYPKYNGVVHSSGYLFESSAGDQNRVFGHFCTPIPLVTGNNTISLWWVASGVNTANLQDGVIFTLVG